MKKERQLASVVADEAASRGEVTPEMLQEWGVAVDNRGGAARGAAKRRQQGRQGEETPAASSAKRRRQGC